jgi:uncharacterized HAD superfamily protein
MDHVMRPEPDMIDPHTMAFDIDGVVADTMGLFIQILEVEFAHSDVRYEDITSYELSECLEINPDIIDQAIGRILTGSYTMPLEPIDGAPEVLGAIVNLTNPLVFVTARQSLGPIESWVKEMLSVADDAIEVIATGSFEAKVDVLLEKQKRVFVEDRLETCFALRDAGIEPILFKQPWNRRPHPFIEVDTWHAVASLIGLQR